VVAGLGCWGRTSYLSFFFTEGKRLMLTGGLNWAALDIRMMLVMTNTTADTQEDVNFLSEITTLDEYDGSGYSRQALATESVDEDLTNNRAEAKSATPVAWTTVGAGTRSAQAAIQYIHVGAESANIPLAFIDSGGFPFNGSGSNINANMNAEGWFQVT